MRTLAAPAAAAVLGFLSYWIRRNVMYPDGISYLEIGDAIFRDGWFAAINGCWSPLLALLSGAAGAIFHPSPAGEFRLMNGINFLIFLGSVASVEWLVRRYWANYGESSLLSRFAFGALLHTVNLVSAAVVTGMSFFTPDLLLMACTAIAIAAILGPAALGNAVLLGVALGLGYLGKSAFLVTGGLLWLAAAAIWRGRSGYLRDLAISAAVFAAIAALYVVPISFQKHRLTFAENGRINYFTHVLGVSSPADGGTRFGPPAIPVESLSEDPRAYGLPRWTGVTYPFHYDVSRFYEGWTYTVSPAAHLPAIAKSLRVYRGVLMNQAVIALVLTAIALIFLAGRRRPSRLAWLLVPVLGSAAVFALVHVEGRYTSPLFVPGCLAIVSMLRDDREERRKLAGCAVLAACLVCAAIVFRGAAGSGLIRDSHPDARFAESLARAGARSGDAVAVVGLGYNRAWARVGGYRIAAEIPDADKYEQSPGANREALAARLRALGVRAMVRNGAPPGEPGWTQAEGTRWSYRMLD